MVQVGMYWLQIKGRFGNPKSRTYLAMKYGYRWLHRVQINKTLKPKVTIQKPICGAERIEEI